MVLDPTDRSPVKCSALTPSARAVKHMMAELELIDIWKALHKTQQDFSFYSRPHKSFSRIDFFLLHKTQEYLPRTLSDHSTLVLTVNAPTTRTVSSYLLNDLDFIAFLNDNIELFFTLMQALLLQGWFGSH